MYCDPESHDDVFRKYGSIANPYKRNTLHNGSNLYEYTYPKYNFDTFTL